MEKKRKNTYNLIRTEKQPGHETPSENIFAGDYWECMEKFHTECSFSFINHKEYSYTEYEIKEAQND